MHSCAPKCPLPFPAGECKWVRVWNIDTQHFVYTRASSSQISEEDPQACLMGHAVLQQIVPQCNLKKCVSWLRIITQNDARSISSRLKRTFDTPLPWTRQLWKSYRRESISPIRQLSQFKWNWNCVVTLNPCIFAKDWRKGLLFCCTIFKTMLTALRTRVRRQGRTKAHLYDRKVFVVSSQAFAICFLDEPGTMSRDEKNKLWRGAHRDIALNPRHFGADRFCTTRCTRFCKNNASYSCLQKYLEK